MKTSSTQSGGNPSAAVFLVCLILAMLAGMSNPILGGTKTIPYDEGDTEDIPAAAARLCNMSCSPVPGGCAYTFDMEVFETCWQPVYAIEIEAFTDGPVEPASWPEEWRVEGRPGSAMSGGAVVFYTVTDPVLPGTKRTGFGLVSYSGSVSLRWFPTGQDGILIGKVSRADLSCPTGTEDQSWGSIKAIYR